MKNLENMKALNEMELAKVAGGILPPFILGPTFTPDAPKNDEPGDGGATGGW